MEKSLMVLAKGNTLIWIQLIKQDEKLAFAKKYNVKASSITAYFFDPRKNEDDVWERVFDQVSREFGGEVFFPQS